MTIEERTVTVIRDRTRHILAGLILLGYLGAAPDGRRSTAPRRRNR